MFGYGRKKCSLTPTRPTTIHGGLVCSAGSPWAWQEGTYLLHDRLCAADDVFPVCAVNCARHVLPLQCRVDGL
eukprot:m.780432 g.780432  ORF g.780432 m.780432 type:complete len:73 (-) comp23281_c0_seq8:959-1177(-)